MSLRPPMDPQARERLQRRQAEAADYRLREHEIERLRQEAEIERLEALKSWPKGRESLFKVLEEEELAITRAIAASDVDREVWRGQGALRLIARIRKVLAEADGPPQIGVPS